MLTAFADEHVEAAIVDGLRKHGMDVVTAQERGLRNTDDEILLATATAEGRLMVSRDKDFLRHHNDWMSAGQNHAGIVFLRPRLSIGEAIRRILHYASSTSPADAANVLKFV
jgi:predicted nuclease of predicted toxin-antitoxin system